MKSMLAIFAAALLLSAGAVQAAPKAKPERSAKSIECSKLADEKGLHGKERKKFRSKCKLGKS